MSKARKKAKQEAARRSQPQQATGNNDSDEEEADPWGDILEDVIGNSNNQKDEDLEEDRERLRREREEFLARKARERKMREEAERERRIFEEHQKAEAMAAQSCVNERVAEPRKHSTPKAKVYSQPIEGERSTVDTRYTGVKAPENIGSLTPADARRAVILDAIFNRPNF